MGKMFGQVFKDAVYVTFAFAVIVLISQPSQASDVSARQNNASDVSARQNNASDVSARQNNASDVSARHIGISTPFPAPTSAPYPIPYPYPAPYPQPYPYPYPAPYPAPYPPPAHFYQCFARDPYARQYYATGYDLNATQQYAVSVCVQSTGFPCQALGCYWR